MIVQMHLPREIYTKCRKHYYLQREYLYHVEKSQQDLFPDHTTCQEREQWE